MSNVVAFPNAQPAEITAEDYIMGTCEVILEQEEALAEIQQSRRALLNVLFEEIGKELLAKNKRKKQIGQFVIHVSPPKEREYCLCCCALLHQCVNPTHERPGVFVRADARPSIWVTKAALPEI
jgi:hypothetical protein